jgi:hypothetical protein
VSPEQVARHEAAHACAAVLLGVPVRRVGVHEAGGQVEFFPVIADINDRPIDAVAAAMRDAARRRMKAVLAGPDRVMRRLRPAVSLADPSRRSPAGRAR